MRTGIKPASIMVMALFVFFVVNGCQSTGGVYTDLQDNTGAMGRPTQPGAGDIYVQLAIAYMREGQLSAALQKIKTGLDLDPSNAEAHNVIALLYERLGELGLAEQHFQYAARLQPRNSYVHNAYGTFLCKRQRFEEATREFEEALANPLYQTPEVALTNAGVCVRRKDDKNGAEALFRKALQHNPRFPSALSHMAQISYEAGNMLSVRAYLQRYHEVARSTAASLWLGIRAERTLGDKDLLASYEILLRGDFPDSNEVQLLNKSQR